MTEPVDVTTLLPGTVLTSLLAETITRRRILEFAGASGDFNPMHVDEVLNVDNGMGGVFAHGMLGTGFLGRTLTDALGDIPLTSLSVRCLKIVRPGDRLSCHASVLQRTVADGSVHVLFGVRAVDQDGKLTHDGTATADLPIHVLPPYGTSQRRVAQSLVRWRAIG